MTALNKPASTTPSDAKTEDDAKGDLRATNGIAESDEAPGEAIPGRKMPFEEALKQTLEENAELYRRLA